MPTKATNPAPRRRATNVTAEPAEPLYLTYARDFAKANIIKNGAAAVEKSAKLECHKAMLAAKVNSFEIEVDGKMFDAVIAGGEENAVSVDKLYAKVTAKEITMEQFLKCISAPQANVKRELGTNILAGVLVTTLKEADLSITKRK